uniref:Uncharacterized protein n=1 Tax=Romanomermis culicivorax TaxID=13658 RepID=A0A915IVF1_ROMCU
MTISFEKPSFASIDDNRIVHSFDLPSLIAFNVCSISLMKDSVTLRYVQTRIQTEKDKLDFSV